MKPTAKKLGLALSGGGFRASLYHLGLVRFLRDAGMLSQVSHITSVSGGSILAAHLVLNWDRYNGSCSDFDAVASEFLTFVRLDVRNRIMRRFPLAFPLIWPRRLLGLSNRKLTRTGLLEYHYEKYLYGDVSLFELPERPQLHLLATNLSEGCLCSFNRGGLFMVRRQSCGTVGIDQIHVGLATVAMAVTASSAFPGFFPPLELIGQEVGANAGEFGRQAYTDGGVFDNLGVRMFRCLERPMLASSPLGPDDFLDYPGVVEALKSAATAREDTALRRLAHILVACWQRPDVLRLPHSTMASNGPALPMQEWKSDNEPLLLSTLGKVMRLYHFQLDPLFASLPLGEMEAEALLQDSRLGGRTLGGGDQLWLNRHLVEAAFRQTTGQGCFRRLNSGLDGVLVSDVGKPIEVLSNRRAGGLIRTALRATDILMDRVWQLEKETFHDTRGFVFAPITEVVEPTEDPTALHPEIQRQAANIRTDLDRFSPLEISSLVRHGYCVGRKACRAYPKLFGPELPGNPPWDPIQGPPGKASLMPTANKVDGTVRTPAAATAEARTLQASALRRIWSTFLDYRDWISYVYVPILIPIFVLMPYFLVKSYERSARISHLVDSLSQGSRDLEIMTQLLDGPMPLWVGQPAEEVRTLEKYDFTGFEVIQDSRIIDMRNWNPTGSGEFDVTSQVYGYRRLKVLKRSDHSGNNVFRIHVLASSPKTQMRFPRQQLAAQLQRMNTDRVVAGEKECDFQASWNFESVPPGEYVDLIYEHYSPALFLRRGPGSTSITIRMQADTAEVTRWFLMPRGKEYKNFRIVRYLSDKPDKVEPVPIVTEYLADDYTILAYKLISTDAGYTYEVTWYYK